MNSNASWFKYIKDINTVLVGQNETGTIIGNLAKQTEKAGVQE
jgi:hypothetical protein